MESPTMGRHLTNSQHWDSFWTRSTGLRKLRWYHPYFGRRGIFVRAVQAQAGDLQGKKVLELGGGGHNFRLLALRQWLGAEVTALDFSATGLEQLQNLFAFHQQPVDVLAGDMFGAGLAPLEGQFDLVCHWGVIEHFEPADQVLEVCHRLLKPGGKLVFSLPNLNSLMVGWFKRYSPQNYATHIPYTYRQLHEALARTGFGDAAHRFFGYPVFQYYHWEKSDRLTRVLGWLHKLGMLSGLVVPYAALGSRLWSMELLFVATRP